MKHVHHTSCFSHSLLRIQQLFSRSIILCIVGIFPFSTAYCQVGTNPKPISAYLFDTQNEREVFDSGPFSSHGSLKGAIAYEEGKYGTAIALNGIVNGEDNYVLVGNPDHVRFNRGFTCMAWVNPASYGQDPKRMEILEKTDAYWMNIRNEEDLRGRMRVGIIGKQGDETVWIKMDTPDPIPLNTWTHCTFTYDGQVLKSYINGVQVAFQFTNGITGINDPETNLTLGCKENIDGSIEAQWHGKLDELRLFDEALSEDEINYYLQLDIQNSEPKFPNLILSDLSFDLESDTDEFTLSGTVTNEGDSLSGEFDVTLYFSEDSSLEASDIEIGKFTLGSLDPSQSQDFDALIAGFCSYTALTPKIYMPGLIIDVADKVSESNESDNTFIFSDMPISNQAYCLTTDSHEGILTPSIHIGPNPFTQSFHISLPQNAGVYAGNILTLEGKTIKRLSELPPGENQISLEGEAKGMYLLHILDKDRQSMQIIKLLKLED